MLEAHVYGQQKKKPRECGGDVASIGDGLFLLEGVERPTLLAAAEADGLEEVPAFICRPLGVGDVSGPLVVNGDEMIGGVTGDPPGVGTTHEDLSLRGSSGHMCVT